MSPEPDAPAARAHDTLFVRQCSLVGLKDKLPLRWPTPPGTPPSPKHTYRSHYTHRGWQDLLDQATWEHLSPFDLILRLVDFSGLRPVLAQRLGWTNARGCVPFDPVSVFLLHGWQITNDWSRSTTLRHLCDGRYADYADRFGFRGNDFPTEGGLRYHLTALGAHAQTPAQSIAVPLDNERTVDVPIENLNDLITGTIGVLQAAGLFAPEAWQAALVCPDGMIHDAASRMRCAFVQDSCYQPLTSDHPQRPCPAKAADIPRRGCACDTVACASVCRYGTPRDPHARMVVYSGSNHHTNSPNQPAPRPSSAGTAQAATTPRPKTRGALRYGYRSLRQILADPQRRSSAVLLSTVLAAPDREENPSAALLRQVPTAYPTVHLCATAGDAAMGYEAYLGAAFDLGVKRIVDLRSDASDTSTDTWVSRGYDNKGRPLCPFGYALTANGFDAQRKRHKWVCGKTCLTTTEPRVTLPAVTYPPHECPYQAAIHRHGLIRNVGKYFTDGSIRLVRDLPVDTPAWKQAYHRARNAVESRHATLEGWGFKRLPVYGLLRGKAMIFQADAWANLVTLARLVSEATHAARAP